MCFGDSTVGRERGREREGERERERERERETETETERDTHTEKVSEIKIKSTGKGTGSWTHRRQTYENKSILKTSHTYDNRCLKQNKTDTTSGAWDRTACLACDLDPLFSRQRLGTWPKVCLLNVDPGQFPVLQKIRPLTRVGGFPGSMTEV